MSETTIAPIAGVTAGAPTSSRPGSRHDSRCLCVRKRGFGERVWSKMAGQCFSDDGLQDAVGAVLVRAL